MTRPDPRVVSRVLTTLKRALPGLGLPVVEKVAEESDADPFLVLISTLLSARTQDATTEAASGRLFSAASTARAMADLPVRRIERLIYPVSFYRHKARHLKETARLVAQTHHGRVPTTMEGLLTLPGVGRKTANLVLIVAHASKENICVDTHVHRISNRLGWVKTRTPEETEQVLYRNVPKRFWPDVNLLLVTWGQNVCRPIGPRCDSCAISTLCPRVGVLAGRSGRPQQSQPVRGRRQPGRG
jgi:endonuclease-3